VIAPQARQVEVEAVLLGQLQQLAQAVQRLGVGAVRAVQEPAELQVDPDDVGPELLHLGEVGLDGGPLVLPVVLDQPPLGVVVVVEAPRHEGASGRGEDEPLLVLGDGDPRHLVRPGLGRREGEEGHHQGHRRDGSAHRGASLALDPLRLL
jgi:hypothetical protein